MADLRSTTAADLVDLINGDASSEEFGASLRSCRNADTTVGAMNLTALHHAVYKQRSDCIERLLQHGASVNVQDYCGYTPVHLAAKHGSVDILKQLVQSGVGADTNQVDAVGLTPLFHALQEGHHACAEVLLQNGANPNYCHKHIGYELHRIPMDTPDCLEIMLLYGADPETRTPRGLTALHAAVEAGNLPYVEILLAFGCEVNAWTTPRMQSKPRRNALQLAIIGNDLDIARCLLRNGANPNCRDQQGNTPLHHASAHRGTDMINLLVASGASVHAVNERLYQPLHRACSAGRDPEILTLLMKIGADTDALTSNNDTPLHCLLLHYIYLTDIEGLECAPLDQDCHQRILAFINTGGRFTITTNREDIRSVLRMLPLMTSFSKTVQSLEAGADRIHVHDSDDLVLALVPEARRARLLAASRNPPCLRQLARRAIRDLIGYHQLEEGVKNLPLPGLLHKYLLFQWE